MSAPSAEVTAYIGRWRPSSVSPPAAAFARDVITAAGPGGQERAKNLLWAAGKLADYAASLGLDLVPGVVLHPSVAERFTRCAPRLSPVALRVPIIHQCWSGCMPVLVEGAAEPVSSADIQLRDPLRIGNRFG